MAICNEKSEIKVGDKVRFTEKGNSGWTGSEGIVTNITHSYAGNLIDYRVTKLPEVLGYSNLTIGKTISSVAGGLGVRKYKLEVIKEELKVGDRVTVKGWETRPNPTWEGRTGVIERFSCGDAVVNFEDTKPYSSGGFELRYLVRATTPAPPAKEVIKAGDKVVVDKDNSKFFYYNTEAVVVEAGIGEYHRVKLTKLGPNTRGVAVGEEHRLCHLTVIPPFTYKDIQKGDTIRRTETMKGGSKEVREGVVTKVATWYVSAENDGYILAYDTDDKKESVTLELMARPEPVKAVWEDAKVGDVFIRTDRDRSSVKSTVARVENGWLVTYGLGRDSVGTSTFDKESTHLFDNMTVEKV